MRARPAACFSSILFSTLFILAARPARAQSILTVAGGGTTDGRAATSVGLAPNAIAFDPSGRMFFSDSLSHKIQTTTPGGLIVTIAGNGGIVASGDGGPATQAGLSPASGLAFDLQGNLFFSGNHLIRKIDAGTGLISTVAGTGKAGFSGDGGPATGADLNSPSGITFDTQGNLYIADATNHRVRKVTKATGLITTIAGNGSVVPGTTTGTYSGDGGPATAAGLNVPYGVAFDSKGDLYVADRHNHRIRKVATSTGLISTAAGGGTPADSLGDNGPATAAVLASPRDIAFDASGNLFIADTNKDRVRRVAASTGIITTVAGGGTPPDGLGDSGSASLASLRGPYDIAFDAAGNLLVVDYGHYRIRKVSVPTGIITTVAGNGFPGATGDGGPATAAGLGFPWDTVLDGSGSLYVADFDNRRIRKVTLATGLITSVAGTGDPDGSYNLESGPATSINLLPLGLALDPAGLLYISDGAGAVVKMALSNGQISPFAGKADDTYSGDGGPATAAGLKLPTGLALDSSGNLYIADFRDHRVRKVWATGTITTVAGNGKADSNGYGTFSGDGGPATSAGLNFPWGVAVDAAGNLFIGDSRNHRVRKVSAATGNISTIAGNGTPADTGDGGPAGSASLFSPYGVTVDSSGNLYVAVVYSIRKIDGATGIISTIAGGGGGGVGDRGPATSASLYPNATRLDAAGNLFIADSGNNRIRLVLECGSPGVPGLSTPSDAAVNVGTTMSLSWSGAPGSFAYDVVLDTVAPPVKVAAENLATAAPTPLSGADASATFSNLQASTTYYWKVVAKGDPFCPTVSTASSAVRSFTTASACTPPGSFELSSPADGAVGVNPFATLSWQAAPGTGQYFVRLGPSNPPDLYAFGGTGTSIKAMGLTPGATYYWGVTAEAACDATKTTSSTVRSFRVAGSCSAPGSFGPSSPANGAAGVDSSTILSWSDSANATSYDLYLGTSTNPPLYLPDISRPSALVSGLATGATYFWRVVAKTSCDSKLTATFAVQTFSVAGTCNVPGSPTITFVPPGNVGVGQTYALAWSAPPELDAAGGYLVERSLQATFSPLVDSQTTTERSASFVATSGGHLYHRVRAIPACDPARAGPFSESRGVNVVTSRPNVIFTVQPAAVITALGDKLEDQKSTFTVENLATERIQVVVARQEIGSVPFFQVVDPFGGEAAFVTLEPRSPRTFEIRFSGPPTDRAGTYQGLVILVATGTQALAVTPYAFVNLKVGGSASAAPEFRAGTTTTEYAFFPGLAGDDNDRPPITVDLRNPGTQPMELGADIGPEVWLQPEAGWSSTPIPPGGTRPVKLYSRRSRAPNGSALPRYTYFTVRTKAGQTARLLVQDNDAPVVGSGRPSQLAAEARSYVVPSVVKATSQIQNTFVTRLRLSNVGSDSVQADLYFTPRDADGFGPDVRRATVVVPPNDVVSLTDPLVQIFGYPADVSTSGQLEVRAAAVKIAFLTVSSSVDAPARSGGTFGFQMPTAFRGEGARSGKPHTISGITSTSRHRTNLIVAETSGIDHAAVRATLTDKDGNRKGDLLLDVPRYGQKQVSVTALGASDDLEAGQIGLVVESGGGSAVGLVTVVDNTNDDAVTYLGRPSSASARPLAPNLLSTGARQPAWARASGTLKLVVASVVNGYPTFRDPALPYTFQSLMGFTSGTASPATFRLTYTDLNTGQKIQKTVTVAGRSTREYPNVVEELFGIPKGQKSQGPVTIEADGNGMLYCKVFSTVANGTLGDTFPIVSVPSESLTGQGSTKPLYVDGLEQSVDGSRGTRSNLILNEVTGLASATVSVSLYEAGNRTAPIAEQEITLGPGEKKQLSTLFAGLALDTDERRKDRTNVMAVVTSRSGSGLVSAIVTTIDNRTGDMKNVLLMPAGGAGATGSTIEF